MKVSYNWLKKYIHTDKTPAEIAESLTSIGLEVEDIQDYSSIPYSLEGLVIGKVEEVWQHPGADRLRLTKVDIGKGELLQIVCGAPNVAAGQKVVVATEGAKLHSTGGEPFVIKKSKIRGEASEGMICAEDEIGIGTDHSGIIILPEDTQVGIQFSDYLHIYEDTVIDVSLTPNRSDAASHIGIARDLAAAWRTKLHYPVTKSFDFKETKELVEIQIKDNSACPRYAGLVIKNIEVKESPQWMQDVLKAIGLSPINNIVDCTNYAMYELGQPIHAFDLAKIKGNKIIVRRAEKGEALTTLDKVERKLDGTELLICNAEKPMALAGVFGGLDSGISKETASIFIESAYFSPVDIRRTSRRHQLFTDASFRYERGTDPNLPITAARRVAELILETAGGEVIGPEYDVYPHHIKPNTIKLDYDFLSKVTGTQIPHFEVREILEALGCHIALEMDDHIIVEVPTYKTDVTRPIDLVEEILRIYSLDKIGFSSLVKSAIQVNHLYTKESIVKKLSSYLTANGFYEAYHLSMGKKSDNLHHSEDVNIINPLSADLEWLRDNMLLPGLKSVLYNLNRKQQDIKFFEWGNTYHQSGGKYWQQSHLSLFITGLQNGENWNDKGKKADYFYLKSIGTNILKSCGIKNIEEEISTDETLEYGIELKSGNKTLGIIGKVKNTVLKKADVDKDVFYADFYMDEVLSLLTHKPFNLKPLSKFPKVERNLSLMLPSHLSYKEIKEAVKKEIGGMNDVALANISIFDVYQGEQVKQGMKSYSVRLELESISKTMEDKVIDKLMQKVISSLGEKFKAEIRQ